MATKNTKKPKINQDNVSRNIENEDLEVTVSADISSGLESLSSTEEGRFIQIKESSLGLLRQTNLAHPVGLRIGGYLFQWGQQGEDGRAWTENTEYGIGWYGRYPIFINHGKEINTNVYTSTGVLPIGYVDTLIKTKSGLRIEGYIDVDNEWYLALRSMIEKERLIWSAAPLSHLNRFTDTEWVSYIIGEFSLKLPIA